MEKSWNVKIEQKVIEFCDQSWNLNISVKSPHFPIFSAKCLESKIFAEIVIENQSWTFFWAMSGNPDERVINYFVPFSDKTASWPMRWVWVRRFSPSPSSRRP